MRLWQTVVAARPDLADADRAWFYRDTLSIFPEDWPSNPVHRELLWWIPPAGRDLGEACDLSPARPIRQMGPTAARRIASIDMDG